MVVGAPKRDKLTDDRRIFHHEFSQDEIFNTIQNTMLAGNSFHKKSLQSHYFKVVEFDCFIEDVAPDAIPDLPRPGVRIVGHGA
jgi:hypothetical protein